MWSSSSPEQRATAKPFTWWRSLVAGVAAFVGAVACYALGLVGFIRLSNGLFIALFLAILGVALIGNGVYRLARYGRFDSGYDPAVDDALEAKLSSERGDPPQQP
jgi:amino acid transporter